MAAGPTYPHHTRNRTYDRQALLALRSRHSFRVTNSNTARKLASPSAEQQTHRPREGASCAGAARRQRASADAPSNQEARHADIQKATRQPRRDVGARTRDQSERRDRLREKLATAEVALDQALTARRKALLESDGEVGSSSQEIVGLGLDRDALLDALEQIEAKVAHLESRLKQERSRAEREMAASELDDQTRKLVAAIEALRNAAATVSRRCRASPRACRTATENAKDLRDLLLTT